MSASTVADIIEGYLKNCRLKITVRPESFSDSCVIQVELLNEFDEILIEGAACLYPEDIGR